MSKQRSWAFSCTGPHPPLSARPAVCDTRREERLRERVGSWPSLLCQLSGGLWGKSQLQPVLWIRDILLGIWIRRSVLLTYGSGSCFFRQWLTRCQKTKIFFQSFFAFHFLKVHYISFQKFKDKKSKRSQKIVEFKVSLPFFGLLMEGSGSGSTTLGPTKRP